VNAPIECDRPHVAEAAGNAGARRGHRSGPVIVVSPRAAPPPSHEAAPGPDARIGGESASAVTPASLDGPPVMTGANRAVDLPPDPFEIRADDAANWIEFSDAGVMPFLDTTRGDFFEDDGEEAEFASFGAMERAEWRREVFPASIVFAPAVRVVRAGVAAVKGPAVQKQLDRVRAMFRGREDEGTISFACALVHVILVVLFLAAIGFPDKNFYR
jgi:hypothetical protein